MSSRKEKKEAKEEKKVEKEEEQEEQEEGGEEEEGVDEAHRPFPVIVRSFVFRDNPSAYFAKRDQILQQCVKTARIERLLSVDHMMTATSVVSQVGYDIDAILFVAESTPKTSKMGKYKMLTSDIVGFLFATTLKWEGRTSFNIEYICTLKRERGIGTLLMNSAETYARTQKHTVVTLQSLLTAVDFYKKHGYTFMLEKGVTKVLSRDSRWMSKSLTVGRSPS
jgi:hypothetical protein